MDDRAAVIGGAIAGCLAPLSNIAVKAFNGAGRLSLGDIPFVEMLVFGLIGATVVYFMAERVRRHVFVYGLAGPFLVLGVINSQRAQNLGAEVKQTEEAAKTLLKANDSLEKSNHGLVRENASLSSESSTGLGGEAIEAILESDEPAI